MNDKLELLLIVLTAFTVSAAGLHDWREAVNLPNVVAFLVALTGGLRALQKVPKAKVRPRPSTDSLEQARAEIQRRLADAAKLRQP